MQSANARRPIRGCTVLAMRLSEILRRLSSGDELCPRHLANELSVDVRTIQRDLRERFAHLGLVKSAGRYRLADGEPGRLGPRQAARLAEIAGLAGISEVPGARLLDIVRSATDNPFQILGTPYEDLRHKQYDFQLLEQAIRGRLEVAFRYAKEAGEKDYAHVKPYRLVNNVGLWYLAAVDAEKIKAFTFSKIRLIRISKTTFERSIRTERILDGEDSVWLTENKTRVDLIVSPGVASYFLGRRILPGQKIERRLGDGGLMVSARIAHPDQILPLIRQWIPHIRVESPASLQTRLEDQLYAYLGAPRQPHNLEASA